MDIQIIEFPDAVAPELCDRIVAKFEADSRKARSSYDPAQEGRDYRQADILAISPLPEWKVEDGDLCQIISGLCAEYMARFKTGEPLIDYGYTIAKYGIGDGCLEHKDTSYRDPEHKLISLVLFLNDVQEGGELVFPLHGVRVKPEKGKAVLYPSLFTYRHFVEAVRSNPRYVIIAFVGNPERKSSAAL